MALQYVMRAFNTNLSKHVYWYSLNSPDNTGSLSGYNPAQLTGIAVDYTTTIPDTIGVGNLNLLVGDPGPAGPGYFSGIVSGGNITIGKAVLVINNQIVPFSLASLAEVGSLGGVALSTTNVGLVGNVRTQGPDATIGSLGDGYVCAVGCKSDGTLCRVTDLTCVSGFYYLGHCDNHGGITISPRVATQYNVLDYGLVNDGTTPNDDAMDNLRAVITTNIAGIVYFSPGEYLFNKTINVFPVSCVFRGSDYGFSASLLKFGGTGYFFNANSGQIFENLSFIGTYYSNMKATVISNASNTSPIIITTELPHNYNTGDLINIYDIKGNTIANNDPAIPWKITKTGNNTFSLNGSTGNGTYSNTSIAITNATNTNPIVITTAAPHGLRDQQTVNVNSVLGNTAANGNWQIQVSDSTHFSLYINSYLGFGVAGNGNYTGDGYALAGGIALTNTGIPFIGLNIGLIDGINSAGIVTVRNCTFDSFKYQISVDGGELIYIEKCIFGAENGGLVLEMFSDYSTHSCFAIRIGSFDQTIGQDANVVYVDQCQFINSYRSMYHHDGITHVISRCNFEQPVMATIQGGCESIVYEKCENDGTIVDAIQFISDAIGGTASFNFTLRDCFLSGTKAAINLNTGVGYPVSLYGLSVINNVWTGAHTLAQGGEYYAQPVNFNGNTLPNIGSNPIWDGAFAYPNSYEGTTINSFHYPKAALDLAYSSSQSPSIIFPAIRIVDASGYLYLF